MKKINKINKISKVNKHLFASIDPGKNGAISIFKVENNEILPLTVFNVPLREKMTGKGYHIDFVKLGKKLNEYKIEYGIIENITAMHQQGATGAFYYGGSFFGLIGLFTGKEIPLYLLSPRLWRNNKLVKGLEKRELVDFVLRLYPAIISHIQPITKDQDKADSVLIGTIGFSLLDQLEKV